MCKGYSIFELGEERTLMMEKEMPQGDTHTHGPFCSFLRGEIVGPFAAFALNQALGIEMAQTGTVVTLGWA